MRGGGLYGSVTLGMRKRCTSYYGLEEGWALPEKKEGIRLTSRRCNAAWNHATQATGAPPQTTAVRVGPC